MQSIEIQYRDGRDDTIQGDDLAGKWDEITETPGIQYAQWRVAKRSGDGTRSAGHLGERREDRAGRIEREQADRTERDRAASQARIAARTWEWTAHDRSLGTC